MNHLNRATLALLLAMAALPARAATIADFAADFSATTNPSSGWSYGFLSTIDNSFTASGTVTNYAAGDVVKAWSPNTGANTFWPTVGLNTGAAPAAFGNANAVHLAAGQGLLHPGPTGDFAAARYTVAADTTALLSTTFSGIDDVGTTTDVHVLLNGISLFDETVVGFGTTRSYSATLALQAGDILDFTVGWGTNFNYVDDSTGFYATLASVDVAEPASASLLVLSLAGLMGTRRRTPHG